MPVFNHFSHSFSKTCLRIFLILMPALFSFSEKENSYRHIDHECLIPGERIEYRVHYGFINAGEAVLKIDPTHIHSLYYVGLVYRETGETEKALQAFEEVLSLNPDPQLANAVQQEITVLKDQPLSSGFPGSELNQGK